LFDFPSPNISAEQRFAPTYAAGLFLCPATSAAQSEFAAKRVGKKQHNPCAVQKVHVVCGRGPTGRSAGGHRLPPPPNETATQPESAKEAKAQEATDKDARKKDKDAQNRRIPCPEMAVRKVSSRTTVRRTTRTEPLQRNDSPHRGRGAAFHPEAKKPMLRWTGGPLRQVILLSSTSFAYQ